MDILQYILQNFSQNENFKKFAPVIELAVKNNFDLKKMLNGLDANTLLPLLSALFAAPAAAGAKTAAVRAETPLAPVSSVADRDISYCLNRYFSAGAN